jgi:hypothetical protein
MIEPQLKHESKELQGYILLLSSQIKLNNALLLIFQHSSSALVIPYEFAILIYILVV